MCYVNRIDKLLNCWFQNMLWHETSCGLMIPFDKTRRHDVQNEDLFLLCVGLDKLSKVMGSS